METKKLVPIVCAIILLVIGIFIYAKTHKKEEGYSKLFVTFSDKTEETNSIKIGQKIGKVDAEIIATEGNKIVIRTYDGQDVEIKLNEEKKVCNKANECALVKLK